MLLHFAVLLAFCVMFDAFLPASGALSEQIQPDSADLAASLNTSFLFDEKTLGGQQFFTLPIQVENYTDGVLYGYAKCIEQSYGQVWRLVAAYMPSKALPHSARSVARFGQFGFGSDPMPRLFLRTSLGSSLFLEITSRGGGGEDLRADVSSPSWSVTILQSETMSAYELRIVDSEYYWTLYAKCKKLDDISFPAAMPKLSYNVNTIPPFLTKLRNGWHDWLLAVTENIRHHRSIGFAGFIQYIHRHQWYELQAIPTAMDLLRAGLLKLVIWSGTPQVNKLHYGAQGLHASHIFQAAWGENVGISNMDVDEFLLNKNGMNVNEAWSTCWQKAGVILAHRVTGFCDKCLYKEEPDVISWKLQSTPLTLYNLIASYYHKKDKSPTDMTKVYVTDPNCVLFAGVHSVGFLKNCTQHKTKLQIPVCTVVLHLMNLFLKRVHPNPRASFYMNQTTLDWLPWNATFK